MKNIVLFLAFGLISYTGISQKFAYVDTEYILQHMQEYADAQTELNALSAQWQEEIEEKYASITLLTESFQAEKALLTVDMQQRRSQDIKDKNKDARELQKKRFGVNGDLFQKREELMKPVQDMMYEAIQQVCSQNGYMVIFDKANQSNMLYANPKHDVSDKVLKKMGKTPGETIDTPSKDDSSEKSSGGSKSSGNKTDSNIKSNTVSRGKTGGK